MIISASWTGGKRIRVSLTFDPGELHARVRTPLESEAWLKWVLLTTKHEPPQKTTSNAKPITPKDKP